MTSRRVGWKSRIIISLSDFTLVIRTEHLINKVRTVKRAISNDKLKLSCTPPCQNCTKQLCEKSKKMKRIIARVKSEWRTSFQPLSAHDNRCNRRITTVAGHMTRIPCTKQRCNERWKLTASLTKYPTHFMSVYYLLCVYTWRVSPVREYAQTA